MKTLTLFPTLIHHSRLPSAKAKRWLPLLQREAKLFRELDEAGEKWSRKNYPGGYTSYSSITDLAFRSTQFGALRDWIDERVLRFAQELELDLGGGRLEMSDFWLNSMGPGCQHSFHLHPLSVISGTFYLRVPPGAGGLQFEDPRISAFMASPPRRSNAKPGNQKFFTFRPVSGDLLLFESWLRHQVPAHQGKTERVSVSFNYEWKRENHGSVSP